MRSHKMRSHRHIMTVIELIKSPNIVTCAKNSGATARARAKWHSAAQLGVRALHCNTIS